jgi:hypothetical protein
MWTPKRVVMLVLGFVLNIACYYCYARTPLGVIDGLPTLPDQFRRPDNKGATAPTSPPRPGTRVDQRLKDAFGLDCQELSRPIKMEMHARNMVLAAGQVSFEDDGRVCLYPVSIAIFGKQKNDAKDEEMRRQGKRTPIVEINTMKSDRAYLKFDREVHNPSEMAGRKVVGAEVLAPVTIVNNRRTKERDDDLTVYIDDRSKPVYYSEPQHLIWTAGHVHLTDQQSQPKPMVVDGDGMEIDLVADTSPKTGQAARKPKNDNVSGVKSITLKSSVQMYLYVDDQHSGIPGSAPPPPAADRKSNPEDKAEITIKSDHFKYDFNKDHDQAMYDGNVSVHRHLPRTKADDQLFCNHLELRLHRKESAPATAPGQSPPADQSAKSATEQGLEIEYARATGGFKEVLLVAETEKLEARGNEMIHDARKQVTIVRGDPEMEADRDGSKIYAGELVIEELPPAPDAPKGPDGKPKRAQKATVKGAGHVDLIDKRTEEAETGERTPNKANNHAYWTERLLWTRDGVYDLLVLTGDARFVSDDQGGSQLAGDTLKVWLTPRERPPDPMAKTEPSAQPAPRPHHLEAVGNVRLRSRDLTIHDTSKLLTWFKDVPPETLPAKQYGNGPVAPTTPAAPKPPAPAPRAPATPSASAPAPAATSMPRTTAPPAQPFVEVSKPSQGPLPSGPEIVRPPTAPAPVTITPPPLPRNGTEGKVRAPAPPPKEEPPPRPIDLSARTIEAWVLRCDKEGDNRNALDKLWCEGHVHVRQDPDPSKPDDKGLDIKGSTLDMKCRQEGNLLIVMADDREREDLAQLLNGSIYIVGPMIKIDQEKNTAAVDGSGAMMLESNNTLAGTKSEKPVPLTIHWTKSMLFTGKSAEFVGEIQAEQTTGARMQCEALTVFFDKPISLKPGNKPDGDRKPDDTPARVQNMVCDRSVKIEEETNETDAETGEPRLVKFQKIEAHQFDLTVLAREPGETKDENEIRASGGGPGVPGKVRLYQPGGGDDDPIASPMPRGTDKPKPKNDDDKPKMTLTYVEFTRRMWANSRSGRAIFDGSVRLLHQPGGDPRAEIDLDTMLDVLPKDAMYLTCDQLEVKGQRTPQGKTVNQEMIAKGRVKVQAKEYWGNSDTMYFDEAKDQLILRGGSNGLATLYKREHIGEKAQEITGEEIIYIRSTGAFTGTKLRTLTGN